MKLVAYLRVSTVGQAEDGLGLEVQEQSIRKWAHANGHRVVAWTRDEGLSGSNGIDSRRGLHDALGVLKKRKAHGLVVYRLDRLARDLILQEQLLADLKRMGAEVFSTSAAEAGYLKDDPDDPSRKLIRQVLGSVAEYERSMIAMRLRSGKARKIEKGGYGGGRPPYGWRAQGRELVPNVDEQNVLKRIRELRRGGLSFREIAARLDAEGHRPRGTRKGPAKRWHPEQLRLIVNRQS
jgi:DNA invertase Pin-like site-specific DNA recombinase